MTTKRKKQQYGVLKVAVMTGSLVATLAGTYILGLHEPVDAQAAAPTVQPAAQAVPANEPTRIQLPPNGRSRQLSLQPIPQVVQPRIRPIARSRSSR